MYLQAFILVLLTGKMLRKIFFGQLRPAEFEVRALINNNLNQFETHFSR